MGKKIFTAVLFFLVSIFSAEAQQQQQVKMPERLNFNDGYYDEISPAIIKGKIVFCSNRRIRGPLDRTGFNGRLYNFFQAEIKDTSGFMKPEILTTGRTNLFNNGPFCFSPDGGTIYFTSEIETGNLTRSKDFKNHLGIFSAPYYGDKVGSISPFRHNNKGYDTGQPSLSNDGKILYFASDMPGGIGGSDIYYCELVNGEWSNPINLGSRVNSNANENYPYFHSSGRLYFASNRTGGIGKLDLYVTTMAAGIWQSPSLLPEPINSTSDDFALVADENLGKVYFASNRNSTDDIFRYSLSVKKVVSCDSLQENSYCYRFTEEIASVSDSIPFRYVWNFGDGTRDSGVIVEHCYPGPGTYTLQLDAVNLVTDEILFNQKTEIIEVTDIEQPYFSIPDTLIAGRQVHLSADKSNLPGWAIDHFSWNFGDGPDITGLNADKTFGVPGIYTIQLFVYGTPQDGKIQKEACVSKKIVVIPKP